MSKYRCVFRNCSTINTPGKGVMPPACAAKGCTGKFNAKPKCKTFMQDALPPEPIMANFEWGEITAIETRFDRRHSGVYITCKRFPARAVAQA